MNSASRPTRYCRHSLLVRKGGGSTPCDERAVFTAVVYALTSGCAWRHLPPTFGTSPATAHRRFTVGTEAGPGRRLHRAVLDELGARGEVNWISATVDAASVRAKGGDGLPGRTRSIAARRAASRTCCPMPRASRSPSPCPARTCTTASPSSRSSAAYPPSGPAGDHGGADPSTPREQGVLIRRTPGLAARARARRAHRAARHRVRLTPRSAPLKDRTVRSLGSSATAASPSDRPHRRSRTRGWLRRGRRTPGQLGRRRRSPRSTRWPRDSRPRSSSDAGFQPVRRLR